MNPTGTSFNTRPRSLATRSIIDYTGGIEDLEAKRVRVIGDPDERFREDPVRMMRAVAIVCPSRSKRWAT